MSHAESLAAARSRLDRDWAELNRLRKSRSQLLQVERDVREGNRQSISQAFGKLMAAAPMPLLQAQTPSSDQNIGQFLHQQGQASMPHDLAISVLSNTWGQDLEDPYEDEDIDPLECWREAAQSLVLCARQGLRRVEDLKHKSVDIASQCWGLSQRAHGLQDEVDKILSSAEMELENGERQMKLADEEYKRVEADLSAVRQGLEQKEGVHTVLLVGRSISRLLFFVPGTGIVAFVLGLGASALRSKIEELQAKKKRCESILTDARAKVNTLKSEVKAAQSTALIARKLANICKECCTCSRDEQERARQLSVHLDSLDQAAFRVASKATSLRDKTAFSNASWKEDWDVLSRSVDLVISELAPRGQEVV